MSSHRSSARRRATLVAAGSALLVTAAMAVTPSAATASKASPTVSHVVPNAGPPAGGTKVTIIGKAFGATKYVTFGGVPASEVKVLSSFLLTATSPAHATGTVAVTVVSANGKSSSVVTPADGFDYRQSPEYGRCVKANPVETGEFSEKSCLTPGSASTGRYNWLPGPGSKPQITSHEQLVKMKLALPEPDGNLECSEVEGVGALTGVRSGEETLSFRNCSLDSGAIGCGPFKTKSLTTELVEPEPGVAETEYTAGGEGDGMILETSGCVNETGQGDRPVTARVNGTLSAETKVLDVMTSHTTLNALPEDLTMTFIPENPAGGGLPASAPLEGAGLSLLLDRGEKLEIRTLGPGLTGGHRRVDKRLA
jgi:hypothetical protein